MQVIDDDAVVRGAVLQHLRQNRLDRAAQHQPLALGRQRHRWRQLGQQARQLGAARRRQLDGHAFEGRAQQARQRGVGHAGIAGPALRGQQSAASGELGQQPRFAEARFADQQRHAPAVPGGLQRRTLALPADHPRRPQYRGWHRARHRRCGLRGRQRRAQRAGQLFGLGRGRGIEARLQVPHQARVGALRLRDVAAQVMQPHQRPMVGFAVGVGLDELLGQSRCRLQVAAGFGLREALPQLVGGAAVPPHALLLQPCSKRLAVVERQLAKQRSSVCRQRIDRDALLDEQRVGAVEQFGAEDLPEARDLLAQRQAGVVRVGPKQRRRARPRDARLERDQRQQSGGAPLQRPDAAIGRQQCRIAEQADAGGVPSCSHRQMITRH